MEDPMAAARADLDSRICAMGLRDNIRELDEKGYTIIQDPVAHSLTDHVRETILRLAEETEGAGKGLSAGLLFGRDPVFDEALLVPKLQLIVEYMVGKGAFLYQLLGTVKEKGESTIGLHCDSSWFPAPFPEWDMLATACWVTDSYTKEGGCTLIVPGSHRASSHPSLEMRRSLEGGIPIECGKGSLVVWNNRVWHSNYPRTIDGERVVLHMTFSRLGLTPAEDYRHITDDYLAGKPHELATLVGRDAFFGSTTTTNGGVDSDLLTKTFMDVHGDDFYMRDAWDETSGVSHITDTRSSDK